MDDGDGILTGAEVDQQYDQEGCSESEKHSLVCTERKHEGDDMRLQLDKFTNWQKEQMSLKEVNTHLPKILFKKGDDGAEIDISAKENAEDENECEQQKFRKCPVMVGGMENRPILHTRETYNKILKEGSGSDIDGDGKVCDSNGENGLYDQILEIGQRDSNTNIGTGLVDGMCSVAVGYV